ncbi:hypothetical protein SJ05684_a37800 (plasmid) [Sinorhizobium sojae CCBAU 05684]|uniref:Uncharacterized protein n=1 Tax=Sinorhizobium sojae CCBAU 05684 TaxID=716928 RepID=A0A249PN44_9HYPH|nr:hypothetical protein SJ05684_a37800 [Sinorhizobium sojae CCBAU 05684]AWI61793.1 hypothetical protein AB395_00004268 [Sinorhizobium fredii CCBAU 45436]AWM29734.1 hypothetical protein AOX55_00004298 [Sinorhizobium fredii CCBAU 25509]
MKRAKHGRRDWSTSFHTILGSFGACGHDETGTADQHASARPRKSGLIAIGDREIRTECKSFLPSVQYRAKASPVGLIEKDNGSSFVGFLDHGYRKSVIEPSQSARNGGYDNQTTIRNVSAPIFVRGNFLQPDPGECTSTYDRRVRSIAGRHDRKYRLSAGECGDRRYDPGAGAIENGTSVITSSAKMFDGDRAELLGIKTRTNPFLAICVQVFRTNWKIALVSCENADRSRSKCLDALCRDGLSMAKAFSLLDTGFDDRATRETDDRIDLITEGVPASCLTFALLRG